MTGFVLFFFLVCFCPGRQGNLLGLRGKSQMCRRLLVWESLEISKGQTAVWFNTPACEWWKNVLVWTHMHICVFYSWPIKYFDFKFENVFLLGTCCVSIDLWACSYFLSIQRVLKGHGCGPRTGYWGKSLRAVPQGHRLLLATPDSSQGWFQARGYCSSRNCILPPSGLGQPPNCW